MIDLRSFLRKKPKDIRSYKVTMLLILLIVTMSSVKLAEAHDLRKGKVASDASVIVQEPEKPAEPAPAAPAAEATSPAPTVAVATPPKPKAQVKSAPSPKTQASATKRPVSRRSATSAPSSTPAVTDNVSTSMTASEILSQINYQRRANGLGNVSLNGQLSAAALAKAKHMADNNYFAHTAPDGTGDFYFVNNSGYGWTSAGVNLAMGDFADSQALVNAWMDSDGHRKNILASYGKVAGIGIYGKYFVMIIAN